MNDYAVIIKARMSSQRLPGKALAVYCPDGTPNLAQIVYRWRASDRDPVVIVATTSGADDDVIEAVCRGLDVPCFRGSRDNVTERMDGAIQAFAPDAKWIARGSADNPLVDVGLSDWRFDILAATGADGLHFGLDHERVTYAGTTDIWSRCTWDMIAAESSGSQFEHPGGWYWDNLSRLSVIQIQPPRREYLAPIRTELDTHEDLAMFRVLWDRLAPNDGRLVCIDTLDALKWLKRNPQVAALNASIAAKTQTRPVWRKGLPFLCRSCRARLGAIVAGDFEIRCAQCGKPTKYYREKKRG